MDIDWMETINSVTCHIKHRDNKHVRLYNAIVKVN